MNQVKDLTWSHELLENSCEETLCKKVAMKLMKVPLKEHGGPLTYWFIHEFIITANEATARCLVKEMETLKITNIVGEDIDEVIALLQTSI